MIYKAVIFDAGGVLHPDMSGSIQIDVRNELGLSTDQAAVFWEMVMNNLGVGKITEAEFWPLVSKKFGLRVISPDENLLGRVYEKKLSVRRDILNLVTELKSHGIKTAVLSDTIESHARAQAATGQYEPFDEVFLSNELHVRKPGPKLYQIALEKMGVDAQETIFIDDREINLKSPHALGMRTIFYQNEDRLIAEIKALCLPVVNEDFWVAFTILERADGTFILQHRDNKPTIASPGGITGWGGAGILGESPFEAAFRELTEETNLRPSTRDIEYVGTYRKTVPVHGEETATWAFILKNVDDKHLKIFEGQGFLILKSLKQADALPLSVLLRQVVGELWADVKSRHE